MIISSGTNLAGIMSSGTLPELIQLKEARKKHFNFKTDDEYRQALAKEVFTQAQDFQGNLEDKKLLFLRTNSDTVIRPQYQDELISLFNPENTRVIKNRFGHKKGIVFTFVRRAKRIANFLSSQ